MSGGALHGAEPDVHGGIPICWPQFGMRGLRLKQHGFARNSLWRVASAGADTVTLALRRDGVPAALLRAVPEGNALRGGWELRMTVRAGDDALTQSLQVHNAEDAVGELEFTAALHTYFRVSDLAAARVLGLTGTEYEDYARTDRAVTRDGADAVEFASEVDRLYLSAPGTVKLQDGHRAVLVHKDGFADVVVWNPGQRVAGQMAGLGDWRAFVCVEVVQAGHDVRLAPGQAWTATQTLQSVPDTRP